MPELALAPDFALNYEDWGDSESPAVVLLHGFTSDLRMWAPHVEAFTADYRVIAPDLRGHGRSTAPDDLSQYTMQAYADDLRGMLDALEIDVCALVGCSFGGMIAAHFATEHPERIAGLVLSDASAAFEHPGYDERYRKREAQLAESAALVDRLGTAELGKRAAAGLTDSFLADAMRKRYARMSREGFLGAAKVRRERPDVLPLLRERLTMPVLICSGSDDPVRSASLVMANHIPAARVVTFKDTGHGVPSLRPESFGRTVLGFFNDIEEGRSIPGEKTV